MPYTLVNPVIGEWHYSDVLDDSYKNLDAEESAEKHVQEFVLI